MASFRAEVVLAFEAESLETAGRELRRLEVAGRDAGFRLLTGRVEPLPPEPPRSPYKPGTPYAPPDEQRNTIPP